MKTNNSFIFSPDECIDKISKDTTEVRLLFRGDSLEIMEQEIAEDATFYFVSSEEWQGFEFAYVLRGELRYLGSKYDPSDPDSGNGGKSKSTSGNGSPPRELGPGYYISRESINEQSWFEAKTEVTLLYLSSQPSFQFMQEEIQEYLQLAQEIENKEHMKGHCERLVKMAHRVGKRFDLSGKRKFDLGYAAYFHDLGKAKVPDRIIQKEGPLDDEEWEVMRKHTIWGREMLEEEEFLQRAGEIVEQTHERIDGEGYPKGLSGDEISLEAKIITVVDSYDAMTSDRSYRDGLEQEEAIRRLKENAGAQFDKEVVEAFLEVLEVRQTETV